MMEESYIRERLGEPELLAQLAEEAAELAQAALKLRRAVSGTNPTPVPEDECRAHLEEEVADTLFLLDILKAYKPGKVAAMIETKRQRWMTRITEGGKR